MHDIPQDIVPPRGMTRETLLKLNAAVGSDVVYEEPGEVTEDVDGIPAWVAPSKRFSATLNAATVSLREVQAVGLTRADVPNLHVIEIE